MLHLWAGCGGISFITELRYVEISAAPLFRILNSIHANRIPQRVLPSAPVYPPCSTFWRAAC